MKYIITLFCFFLVKITFSQAIFLSTGKIEFERKLSQHRMIDEDDGEESEWKNQLKKSMPKFVNDYYELYFTPTKTVYKLKGENDNNKYMWGTKPSETDIIVKNLETNKQTTQRDVYEETYLVQDSLRQLDWRIYNETREIAGFECRKAVAKICDSVVVVAFFTDQITVCSGPESFGGLPGMILGLAIPRLGTTWYATKVETTTPTANQLAPKQKGKPVNWGQMNKDLKKAMGDWGKWGEKRMWLFNL
jgi:GLPGLI family protein